MGLLETAKSIPMIGFHFAHSSSGVAQDFLALSGLRSKRKGTEYLCPSFMLTSLFKRTIEIGIAATCCTVSFAAFFSIAPLAAVAALGIAAKVGLVAVTVGIVLFCEYQIQKEKAYMSIINTANTNRKNNFSATISPDVLSFTTKQALRNSCGGAIVQLISEYSSHLFTNKG